jgi:hypothetical protein
MTSTVCTLSGQRGDDKNKLAQNIFRSPKKAIMAGALW